MFKLSRHPAITDRIFTGTSYKQIIAFGLNPALAALLD
jgi:hypothetical protein